MSLKDDLRKTLTPELFTQVTDALGDNFNFDVVPRTRLNTVIGQRDLLKEQIEKSGGTTQSITKPVDPDDDGFVPPIVKGAKTTTVTPESIEAIKAQLEEATKAQILGVKLQYAGLDKLRSENVVDPDVALSLIDLSKVKFKDDGTMEGFDEQVATLKETKKYLFGEPPKKRDGTPAGTGKETGAVEFGGVASTKEFMALSTADQIKFKETYPEKFTEFLTSSI